MPEPQSTAFFVLLMAIFAALMCLLVLARHLAFRLLAACLAFIPAVVFGVAAVNKYYDYYQNWNSAIADVTSQGTQVVANLPGVPDTGSIGGGVTSLLGNQVYTQLAAQDGYTLHVLLRGQRSHLSRNTYIYLPPQYFQPAYRRYRFPAIELIHGFPGAPQDWITVLDVTTTLSNLISRGLAKPAVLVMPDASGARGESLQCLNQVAGPQDATFIAQDVPSYVARSLRVRQPGRSWGIAGYSEGGFCAANLGLRYGSRYGFAGVLSGYFQPMANQLGNPVKRVSPFGHDTALRLRNTPTRELLRLPAGARIPQFWIGSGTASPADVRDAEVFRQLLQLRQPAVTLRFAGGGHSMRTWRLLVPSMLEWMTPKLAEEVALAQARAQRLEHRKARPHARPARGPSPGASPGTTHKHLARPAVHRSPR